MWPFTSGDQRRKLALVAFFTGRLTSCCFRYLIRGRLKQQLQTKRGQPSNFIPRLASFESLLLSYPWRQYRTNLFKVTLGSTPFCITIRNGSVNQFILLSSYIDAGRDAHWMLIWTLSYTISSFFFFLWKDVRRPNFLLLFFFFFTWPVETLLTFV